MKKIIEIQNEGKLICSTNYYDLEVAQKGYFFLSWNAGCARLLVPASHELSIKDMKAAQYVIISRGKYQKKDALELLFEDNSDTPYVIHLDAKQTDRSVPKTEQGGGFTGMVQK